MKSYGDKWYVVIYEHNKYKGEWLIKNMIDYANGMVTCNYGFLLSKDEQNYYSEEHFSVSFVKDDIVSIEEVVSK